MTLLSDLGTSEQDRETTDIQLPGWNRLCQVTAAVVAESEEPAGLRWSRCCAVLLGHPGSGRLPAALLDQTGLRPARCSPFL